jgi:hypothetical protein
MSIAQVLKYRILDTKEGDRTVPVFFANSSGSPVNGTSGTLANQAPAGALLLSQEVQLYQNTGTMASPTWTKITNANTLASSNTLAAGTTGAPPAITSTITNLTTADATHIAAILPTGVAGDRHLVYNSGGASAQTASVYCQTGDTIDGGSSGGHVTLTVAHRAAWFYCVAANTWISALVGAVST